MGQSPKGESYNEEGSGTVFFQGRAEFGFRFPTRRLYTTDPKRMARANDSLMSVRAPVGDMNVAYEDCCIGRGLGAIRSNDGHQSFILYTTIALALPMIIACIIYAKKYLSRKFCWTSDAEGGIVEQSGQTPDYKSSFLVETKDLPSTFIMRDFEKVD